MDPLSLVVLFTTLVSSLFSSASGTSILLPLYLYPDAVYGDGNTNWTPLFNALSAHPSVQFIIIIDPYNGPGAGTLPNGDDSEYIEAISKLNSYPNALLIGYVHCQVVPGNPERVPLSAVEANITTYANWASYTSANISIHGIFIDEAPNDSSDDSLQYVASAAAFARSAIPGAFVVYNPGSLTSDAYYSPVPPDLDVQFESPFSDWSGNATIAKFAGFATGEVGRSAAIAYAVPSAADARDLVRQCVAEGVGGVWATPTEYQDLGYVDVVASALES